MSRTSVLLFAMSLLLVGCPQEEEEEGPLTLTLADANNYVFSGTMDITPYEVQELTDITIDWSLLTEDLQTHPLDPEVDINTSACVVFRYLSNDEVEIGLSENSLEQADVALYVFTDVTGRTSVNLSEHTLFGTDVDVETYFELAYGETWMITLTTGDTPGVGTRMAAFLTPTAESEVTEVVLANDSTVVYVETDMTSLTKPTALATDEMTLDWGGLTTDSQGNPVSQGDIDQVMIGVYNSLDASDLEENLLDLEYVHDGMWYLDLESGGTSADLTELTDNDGGAFPGFSTSGTWMLALRCTTCPNPAPPFLTIVEVVEATE